MNKVFNINLGGYPFTIDEDAYEHLKGYLKAIHQHFQSSEGYEEITADIETRLAELFQDNMSSRPIVTHADVKDAIAIMGTPEDFGAEPAEEEATAEHASDFTERTSTEEPHEGTNYKTGKRVFRNPDDEVVAGVCSGISAYFGIDDPIWIRLAFVAFFIAGGIAIPLYIIMWIVMPKAETASDRLAMRGEPITASNIGKIIEEEMSNMGKKMNELGDELNEKFGSGKKKTSSESKAAKDFFHGGRATLEKGISAIGHFVRAFILILSQIVKPILFIIGFVLIVAFAATWVGAIISLFFGQPFLEFLLPERPWLASLGVFCGFMIISIPLFLLFLTAMRLVFGTRVAKGWKIGLWVLWWASLSIFGSIAGTTAHQFSAEGLLEQNVSGNYSAVDTFRVAIGAPTISGEQVHIGGDGDFSLTPDNDRLVVCNFKIIFEKTDEPDFSVRAARFSRGESNQHAQTLARGISSNARFENGILHIPYDFTIPSGTPFRGQQVRYIVSVPQGKNVEITSEMKRNMHSSHIPVDNDIDHPWFWGNDCKIWRMEESGFICPSWLGENMEMNEQYQDFSKISVKGPIRVQIRKADKYGFRMQGAKERTKKIEINQIGDMLSIVADEDHHWGNTGIFIDVPAVNEIRLKDTEKSKISGFSEANLAVHLDTRERTSLLADVENLNLYLSNRGTLELTGFGNQLIVQTKDSPRVNAEHFIVKKATIQTERHGHEELNLAVTDSIYIKNNSKINVVGGSPVLVEEWKEEDSEH